MCDILLTPQPLRAYPRYKTHETVLQAIHDQEQQMQVLSDIIPGDDDLACVHAYTCPFAHARNTHIHVRTRTYTNAHTFTQACVCALAKVCSHTHKLNLFTNMHRAFRCMFMHVHMDMHVIHIMHSYRTGWGPLVTFVGVYPLFLIFTHKHIHICFLCMFIHITALDMVHSSLVSSMSIDPVRLQSYNMSNPPKTPQITAIPGFEVRIWSLSIISVFISLSKSAISQPCYLLTAVAQPHNPSAISARIYTLHQSVSLSSSLRGMPSLSSSFRGFTVGATQRQYVPVGYAHACKPVCPHQIRKHALANSCDHARAHTHTHTRRVYRDRGIHVMCLVDVCLLSVCCFFSLSQSMRSEPTVASSLYSSISRGPVDGVRYLRESIGWK